MFLVRRVVSHSHLLVTGFLEWVVSQSHPPLPVGAFGKLVLGGTVGRLL